MNHVSDHVLRALWYINVMSSQGVSITTANVDQVATELPPKDAEYGSLLAPLAGMFPRHVVTSPEPVARYLLNVRWIVRSDDGIQLTNLGRAILQASGAQEQMEQVRQPLVKDMTLSPDDPLVYTVLTRRLAAAGAGLLVDPYFKAESIAWVLEATTIRRILISKKASTKERPIIAVALATLPNGRDLEVRATADKELHDRRVIAADGTVQLIGTSINGVGRHETSMVTPEIAIAKAYRDSSEKLWAGAEKVEPQPLKSPVAVSAEETGPVDAPAQTR
ncbi:hypothetical protein ACFYXC_40170 [Streptomyces sp. NPDC002701]|uniref:hypothetical protein n=1 Tax=Streptomyces sp. NPDC002701 TaxID=3364661 RepID=UPI0036B4FD9D